MTLKVQVGDHVSQNMVILTMEIVEGEVAPVPPSPESVLAKAPTPEPSPAPVAASDSPKPDPPKYKLFKSNGCIPMYNDERASVGTHLWRASVTKFRKSITKIVLALTHIPKSNNIRVPNVPLGTPSVTLRVTKLLKIVTEEKCLKLDDQVFDVIWLYDALFLSVKIFN